MRRALLSLSAALCLFASSPATAQNDQPDGRCDGVHCQFIIFEGLDTFGQTRDPLGTQTRVRTTAAFDRNASLKRSFSPELEASLADVALNP